MNDVKRQTAQGDKELNLPSISLQAFHKLLEISTTPLREAIRDQIFLFFNLFLVELFRWQNMTSATLGPKWRLDVTIIDEVLGLLPFCFKFVWRIVRSRFS
jgi:hypothetical protein